MIEINYSNFDCSQIIDCSRMFSHCYSLKEINLGKLDFASPNNSSYMFYNYRNLEKLDVYNFNINNSESFESMFQGCSNLKESVAKFGLPFFKKMEDFMKGQFM